MFCNMMVMKILVSSLVCFYGLFTPYYGSVPLLSFDWFSRDVATFSSAMAQVFLYDIRVYVVG